MIQEIISGLVLMVGLGIFLGVLLGVANIFFAVELDERVEKTTAMLPGLNCGGCGYPGCAGLAEALVSGQTSSVSLCKPCKPDQRALISEYLNTTPDSNGNVLTTTA